jgi:hypothetical protein
MSNLFMRNQGSADGYSATSPMVGGNLTATPEKLKQEIDALLAIAGGAKKSKKGSKKGSKKHSRKGSKKMRGGSACGSPKPDEYELLGGKKKKASKKASKKHSKKASKKHAKKHSKKQYGGGDDEVLSEIEIMDGGKKHKKSSKKGSRKMKRGANPALEATSMVRIHLTNKGLKAGKAMFKLIGHFMRKAKGGNDNVKYDTELAEKAKKLIDEESSSSLQKLYESMA